MGHCCLTVDTKAQALGPVCFEKEITGTKGHTPDKLFGSRLPAKMVSVARKLSTAQQR
jgi:hypothetical protein